MDRRPVALLGRGRRARAQGRRRRGEAGARCSGAGHVRAAAGPQARRDPRSRRRLPRQAARRGGADDLRRGRQADEGRPGRGGARHVHVHVRGRRGAQARRRHGADGRVAGGRRQARVHAAPADRRRRRDLPVQLPAQPRRAQDRSRVGSGLRGGAEACVPDTALGAAARGARARGRPASGVAQRPHGSGGRDRRCPRGGRAREADHLHRLLGHRLEAARARGAQEGRARARQRDAGDRRGRRRPRRGGVEARRERILVRRPELHLRPADLRPAGRRTTASWSASSPASRRCRQATRPTRTPMSGR